MNQNNSMDGNVSKITDVRRQIASNITAYSIQNITLFW